ncbi:hypothetical protein EXIGLDRAFT_723426 [Exidia glandulosa HHB12029]|uniref:F-box domain-containing protein n=1 Tax=Exidia glandulosa HHB12029 TaxID=1314781 RepID=A0A165ETT8_EXIGL|nr:hypothetical protein EXIGLDRAFT_723426 [Exidia glandulosa HHB12029]
MADHRPCTRRLPPEVLCTIFELLNFGDRVLATHICRYWRETSLNAPATLWSHIVTHGRKSGVFLAQLERARSVPVYIRAEPAEKLIAETMLAIQLHMAHIVELSVTCTGNNGVDGIPRGIALLILDALRRPAPLLTDLSLTVFDETFMDETLSHCVPEDFLGENAPLLQNIYLCGSLHVPARCDAFQAVTVVNYDAHAPPSGMSLVEFDQLFPSLEELDFCGQGFTIPPGVRSVHAGRLRFLGSLTDDLPAACFTYYGCHEIPRVFCGYIDGWDWLDFFLCGGRREVRALCIGSGGRHWKIFDTEDRAFDVINLIPSSWPQPSSMRSLTALCLLEVDLTEGNVQFVPPLPTVSSLTIILLPYTGPWGEPYAEPPNIFTWPFCVAEIHVPSLRKLQLAQCGANGRADCFLPAVVAPDDIIRFINACLVFDASRLDEVVLRQVDLYAGIPSAIGELLERVASVTVNSAAYDLPFANEITEWRQ